MSSTFDMRVFLNFSAHLAIYTEHVLSHKCNSVNCENKRLRAECDRLQSLTESLVQRADKFECDRLQSFTESITQRIDNIENVFAEKQSQIVTLGKSDAFTDAFIDQRDMSTNTSPMILPDEPLDDESVLSTASSVRIPLSPNGDFSSLPEVTSVPRKRTSGSRKRTGGDRPRKGKRTVAPEPDLLKNSKLWSMLG
ncbi:hypothetical protein P9112_003517 [Eukaryota sp. TZLM1-RC]